MTQNTKASLKAEINRLENHLEVENPQMLGTVRSYRSLDKIGWRLGLLDRTDSHTTKIAWWPLVAVLGTYSSGKSTFINNVLGQPLQKTGNQAVDDKFTVICYGNESTPRVLPGIALDSDPRFPLYRISQEIDKAIEGEGKRLDSYLQLKACNSEALRGKIIIDSPGFDADAQRTATLRITDHIINLSDLVLVFFDARHPEPGAMQDTLDHLVTDKLGRADAGKFLHILNQIDNAAREDNPEEVFAAWQRGLAQKGLTAERFYRLYDPAAAIPIENEHLKRRFESKREEDMGEIMRRVDELEVERSYRVVGRLEQTAKDIRDIIVPRLRQARRAWRRRVLMYDAIAIGALLALVLVVTGALGWWDGLRFAPPWLGTVSQSPILLWGLVVLVALALFMVHRLMRRLAARSVLRGLRRDESLGAHAGSVTRAFEHNVRSWWPFFFFSRPHGWNLWTRRKLDSVLSDAHSGIRALNDRYTDPSGRREARAEPETRPRRTVEAEHPPREDREAPPVPQEEEPASPQWAVTRSGRPDADSAQHAPRH